MSRRMDREGIHRMEPQRIANERRWAEQARRGLAKAKWWMPFTVADGFEELGIAQFYTRYRLALCKPYSTYERSEWIRKALLAIDLSQLCDRPKLP